MALITRRTLASWFELLLAFRAIPHFPSYFLYSVFYDTFTYAYPKLGAVVLPGTLLAAVVHYYSRILLILKHWASDLIVAIY